MGAVMRTKNMSAPDMPVILSSLQSDEYLFITSTGVYSAGGSSRNLKKIQDRSMRNLTLGVLDKNDVEVEAFQTAFSTVGFLLLQQAMITNKLFAKLTKTQIGMFITFYK